MNHRGLLQVVVQRATIYESTDSIGQMDPYLLIKFGKQNKKSKTHKSGDQTPEWNENFEFQRNDEVFITFQLYEEDAGSQDDFIGKQECSIGPAIQLNKRVMQSTELLNAGQLTSKLYFSIEFIPEKDLSNSQQFAKAQSYFIGSALKLTYLQEPQSIGISVNHQLKNSFYLLQFPIYSYTQSSQVQFENSSSSSISEISESIKLNRLNSLDQQSIFFLLVVSNETYWWSCCHLVFKNDDQMNLELISNKGKVVAKALITITQLQEKQTPVTIKLSDENGGVADLMFLGETFRLMSFPLENQKPNFETETKFLFDQSHINMNSELKVSVPFLNQQAYKNEKPSAEKISKNPPDQVRNSTNKPIVIDDISSLEQQQVQETQQKQQDLFKEKPQQQDIRKSQDSEQEREKEKEKEKSQIVSDQDIGNQKDINQEKLPEKEKVRESNTNPTQIDPKPERSQEFNKDKNRNSITISQGQENDNSQIAEPTQKGISDNIVSNNLSFNQQKLLQLEEEIRKMKHEHELQMKKNKEIDNNENQDQVEKDKIVDETSLKQNISQQRQSNPMFSGKTREQREKENILNQLNQKLKMQQKNFEQFQKSKDPSSNNTMFTQKMNDPPVNENSMQHQDIPSKNSSKIHGQNHDILQMHNASLYRVMTPQRRSVKQLNQILTENQSTPKLVTQEDEERRKEELYQQIRLIYKQLEEIRIREDEEQKQQAQKRKKQKADENSQLSPVLMRGGELENNENQKGLPRVMAKGGNNYRHGLLRPGEEHISNFQVPRAVSFGQSERFPSNINNNNNDQHHTPRKNNYEKSYKKRIQEQYVRESPPQVGEKEHGMPVHLPSLNNNSVNNRSPPPSDFNSNKGKGFSFGRGEKNSIPLWMVKNAQNNPGPGAYTIDKSSLHDSPKGHHFPLTDNQQKSKYEHRTISGMKNKNYQGNNSIMDYDDPTQFNQIAEIHNNRQFNNKTVLENRGSLLYEDETDNIKNNYSNIYSRRSSQDDFQQQKSHSVHKDSQSVRNSKDTQDYIDQRNDNLRKLDNESVDLT